MADPVTISPEEPANKGLDYAYLKQEGLTLVQQLSSDIWTDYNEHDPGVTTLEQLCYALTELSYRAELPLADLLTDEQTGRINARRQALFIPRRILPCNPLTANDYRKLIVDRVPQVANVWLTPYHSRGSSSPVNGLYDIALYVPDLDSCDCASEFHPRMIRRRVRRVYNRRRNLCEDVHRIRILRPTRFVVNAIVSVAGNARPEAILAGIFYNLGNFLAPELRRQSLKTLLDAGQSSSDIFNGPLVHNGFIAGDQLQPKASTISVAELIRVMVRTAGVTSVSGVSVQVGDQGLTYTGDQEIPVSGAEIPRLVTEPEKRSGGFTIKLIRNGIAYQPDASRVERELKKLWMNCRRTYRLSSQYEEFFALPSGAHHDVESYYSIQNQFPNVYGINAFGLPDGASVKRQAQARQFKGYLLVFDQLCADFFAQLAHAKDLYSIEPGLRQTYFYQYLTELVPNIAALLGEYYESGLPLIAGSQDQFADRRNRFLDFLLALYAETLDSPLLHALSDQDSSSGERLIDAKLSFLHQLVASTHNRGRGFDYLAAASTLNVAGMEIKSRIQLGMSAFDRRALSDVLDELGVELVETQAEASVGRTFEHHADYIEENFAPVTSFTEERAQPGVQDTQLLRRQKVTEEFLHAAGDIRTFRAGSLPGDSAVSLVCQSAAEGDWHLVGKYPDLGSAVAAAYALVESVQGFERHHRQLYILEHTLLRFGRSKPGAEVNYAAPDFVYSFTVTAVLSASAASVSDPYYRNAVHEVIRQNTPAHIAVNYCFLRPRQMHFFESLYREWRRALRQCRSQAIRSTSARLREFLRCCSSPPC